MGIAIIGVGCSRTREVPVTLEEALWVLASPDSAYVMFEGPGITRELRNLEPLLSKTQWRGWAKLDLDASGLRAGTYFRPEVTWRHASEDDWSLPFNVQIGVWRGQKRLRLCGQEAIAAKTDQEEPPTRAELDRLAGSVALVGRDVTYLTHSELPSALIKRIAGYSTSRVSVETLYR
jgi:hypothetical protein